MPGLAQKLYQLVIGRLEGDKVGLPSYREEIIELVRKGIGGFILFGGKKDELKYLITQLQSESDIPLFIASDIERGAGQQIEGATNYPSQMAVAAAVNRNKAEDVSLLQKYIEAVANEAIDIGINLPLIPVLDVNRNPDNPIICTRAFSDNAQTVSWFGQRYIEIVEGSGLISCAKHFPGHGDTSADSHISLPVIQKSLNDLMNTDIPPFQEAIKTGVSSIMLGHLSVPSIDSLPASLSRKVVTNLLRNELGYEGLIMTDALNMSALDDFDNIAARCINAGADIILHPEDAEGTVEELKTAVETGSVHESKVDTAFQRIMRYKARLRNVQSAVPDYIANEIISDAIFNKSITLIKGNGTVSVQEMANIEILFAADEHKTDMTGIKQIAGSLTNINKYKGTFGETVIIAIFTTVAAWQGSSGISDEDRKLIEEIIGKSKKSIIISFGSPYALRYFKEADILMAAYDSSVKAQNAVRRCLRGGAKCQGRLPVSLTFT